MNPPKSPRVALFVTCLVDVFRPSVGFSAVKLLEAAGCQVEVPPTQTCCGQPAFNSGDRNDTIMIAMNVIEAFSGYDYVVAPSGSCAGMLKKHYPGLFQTGTPEHERAVQLSGKTHELVSFLSDVMKFDGIEAALERKVTYHDSCSGYRELGIKAQPRKLLKNVDGLELTEMEEAEICCGFGGTFCVKYPDISNEMVSRKVENINNSGADILLAGDMGCLLNMAGKLRRAGSKVEVRHVAEVLAGSISDDPIAGTE